MKKGTKIAIGIGFSLVIGVIVYLIVKTVNSGKQSKEPITNKDESAWLNIKAYKAPMLDKSMKIRELLLNNKQ